MDIKDLQEAKRALERDIYMKVAESYKQFRDLTGIAPESINIDICTIDSFGGVTRRDIVGVKVGITL